jgi:hypothetical protein
MWTCSKNGREKRILVGKHEGKKTQEKLDVHVRIINKVDSTGM